MSEPNPQQARAEWVEEQVAKRRDEHIGVHITSDEYRADLADAMAVADANPIDNDSLAGVREALELILPLAIGYAAEHPVGSNQAYVEQARAALAAIRQGGA